jgi:hypothetical protein
MVLTAFSSFYRFSTTIASATDSPPYNYNQSHGRIALFDGEWMDGCNDNDGDGSSRQSFGGKKSAI